MAGLRLTTNGLLYRVYLSFVCIVATITHRRCATHAPAHRTGRCRLDTTRPSLPRTWYAGRVVFSVWGRAVVGSCKVLTTVRLNPHMRLLPVALRHLAACLTAACPQHATALELLLPQLRPGARVLDVGSGALT